MNLRRTLSLITSPLARWDQFTSDSQAAATWDENPSGFPWEKNMNKTQGFPLGCGKIWKNDQTNYKWWVFPREIT